MVVMELITTLLDFILHIDKYLEMFVTQYGLWVYALLFLIIFVETGVVVMPFLPGDSLLFVVGAMCGLGLMSYPLTVVLLFVAAVLGNHGKIPGSSIRPRLTRPMRFTSATAASRLWPRVSCHFYAPSPHLLRA
jgi:hypothetical protein